MHRSFECALGGCSLCVPEDVAKLLDDAEEREALEQVACCAFSLLAECVLADFGNSIPTVGEALSRLSLALGALPDATKERLRGMK